MAQRHSPSRMDKEPWEVGHDRAGSRAARLRVALRITSLRSFSVLCVPMGYSSSRTGRMVKDLVKGRDKGSSLGLLENDDDIYLAREERVLPPE